MGLRYATVTHVVCECTHFTDFGAAYVKLFARSSDVLGETPNITLEQVAENIPVRIAPLPPPVGHHTRHVVTCCCLSAGVCVQLLIVIGVMLFAAVGMVVFAHKLDKADPPPLLLPSSKVCEGVR